MKLRVRVKAKLKMQGCLMVEEEVVVVGEMPIMREMRVKRTPYHLRRACFCLAWWSRMFG